jgi:subtilase family serine protease
LLSLAASASLTVNTAVYLPSAGGTLDLVIDAGNAVAESDETNNHFFISYTVPGNCKDLPGPPVVF